MSIKKSTKQTKFMNLNQYGLSCNGIKEKIKCKTGK